MRTAVSVRRRAAQSPRRGQANGGWGRILASGNAHMVRDYNRWLVLDKIRLVGAISRVDLARQLSLSNTAVSKITAQLIEQGLVIETGLGKVERGRKPLLLEIKAGAGFILVFDLSRVYTVHGAVTDLSGRSIATLWRQLENSRPDAVADAIAGMAAELESHPQVDPERVLGLGISATGVVDYVAGVVVQSVTLGWDNVPLRKLVEQRVRRPVTVDWVCNALALAEFRSHGTGIQAVSHVVVGEGIGAALVFDGSIFRGTAYNAGEFGHTVVMANGPRCRCGNWGCIEALASHHAMLAEARALVSEGATGLLAQVMGERGDLRMQDLVAAVAAGDEMAIRVVRRAGHYFGVGATNLVNLLNIQRVVVQFDYPAIAGVFLEAAREVVGQRALRHLASQVEILESKTGPDAALIGTVQMVLQQLFRNPTESTRAAGVITPVWQY